MRVVSRRGHERPASRSPARGAGHPWGRSPQQPPGWAGLHSVGRWAQYTQNLQGLSSSSLEQLRSPVRSCPCLELDLHLYRGVQR